MHKIWHSLFALSTPAEVFFEHRSTTPMDVLHPRTAFPVTLTDTQVHRRHGARPRHFKQGENVIVELWNGK